MMTTAAVNTVANTTINSVYINTEGKLDFDTEGFGSSLGKMSAWSGVVSAGISGTMNAFTQIDGLAKNIWNDKIKVKYDAEGDAYGFSDVDNRGTIHLSKDLLGVDGEQMAKLASVMAHEGTHAYGNRIEGIAHAQAGITYDTILQEYGLKGDKQFANAILAGFNDAENWKENSGGRDYWKVMNDGTLVRDGRKSVYIDTEDGEFKLLNYDWLDSDIESFAAMMGLYKNKSSNEEKLKMQQELNGLSFDEAVQKMNQYYKNNLNVEAAEKLVNEFTEGFIQAPYLSDTIGVANSAYHVLKDYLHVEFSELTFDEVLWNIANVNQNSLGSYLDLTQIKAYEQKNGYKDGKDYSSNEFFNNLGISYASVYYTLEQINPDTVAAAQSPFQSHQTVVFS